MVPAELTLSQIGLGLGRGGSAFVVASDAVAGVAGDRLDPEPGHVFHELTQDSAPRGVEREPVVAQQPLGHAMGGDRLVEDHDRVLDRLTPGCVRGHGVAGVCAGPTMPPVRTDGA